MYMVELMYARFGHWVTTNDAGTETYFPPTLCKVGVQHQHGEVEILSVTPKPMTP